MYDCCYDDLIKVPLSTHHPQNMTPEGLRVISCFLVNVSQIFMFLLVRHGFHLAALHRVILAPPLSLALPLSDGGLMNADFICGVLQLLRCSSGFFVTSWMSHRCSWRSFGRWASWEDS
ncbi:hypothetical protein LDENG_00247150 [Lucifuga dentata]|nr:hypothetical protein LDENG_00247150 [Lucifuga dentata]